MSRNVCYWCGQGLCCRRESEEKRDALRVDFVRQTTTLICVRGELSNTKRERDAARAELALARKTIDTERADYAGLNRELFAVQAELAALREAVERNALFAEDRASTKPSPSAPAEGHERSHHAGWVMAYRNVGRALRSVLAQKGGG